MNYADMQCVNWGVPVQLKWPTNAPFLVLCLNLCSWEILWMKKYRRLLHLIEIRKAVEDEEGGVFGCGDLWMVVKGMVCEKLYLSL